MIGAVLVLGVYFIYRAFDFFWMANLGDIASQAEDTNGIEVVLGVNIHLREKPIGLSEGEKMTVGSGPIRNFILGGSDHSAYFQLALAARISRCYDVCVVEVCYGNNGLTVTGQFYT